MVAERRLLTHKKSGVLRGDRRRRCFCLCRAEVRATKTNSGVPESVPKALLPIEGRTVGTEPLADREVAAILAAYRLALAQAFLIAVFVL